jgi:hypothetical protein
MDSVRATETAARAFLENLKIYRKKDKPSQAYDVVYHKILLFKLYAYGIRGIVNQWFKTYLCNLKQ